MVEINLFPWREYKQIYEKSALSYLLTFSLILPISIIAGSYVFLSYQLNMLNQRVMMLDQAVKKIEDSNHTKSYNQRSQLALSKMVSNFTAHRANTINLF